MGLLEYFIILLILMIVYIYLDVNIVFLDGDEDLVNKLSKPEVKISDNINIHNPNISIPAEPLSRGLSNVGIGAAVAGGMSAASTIIQKSSLPPRCNSCRRGYRRYLNCSSQSNG